MKKLSASEKAAYSLATVMLALFLCAAILALSLFSMLSRTEKEYSEYRTGAEIKLSDLEKKKNEINAKTDELKGSLELAEKTRAELERRISQTESELSELKNSVGNTDELYKKLNSQLSSLKSELAEKNSEIESLNKDLKALSETYGSDINKQYSLLLKLYELLENPPKIEVNPAIYDDEGNLISEAVYADAKISLYYEDMERGNFFKFNEAVTYPSSGCVEVPFVLSVLKAASNEMLDYEKKLAEYIAVNGETDELPDFVFKYDMNKVFTYTEDKATLGSGIIKDGEFGTEYTYYELLEHLIKYGDSVAYAELKSAYGTVLQKNLLTSIGTGVMKSDPSLATASDLALVMKETYSFLDSNAYYAQMMKDTMVSSVHSVMITPGIIGKTVAHTHGWSEGAYHDMAVVYDTHPYVLVFMSDLDDGGEEVNAYINKLASVIDDIHESFYN